MCKPRLPPTPPANGCNNFTQELATVHRRVAGRARDAWATHDLYRECEGGGKNKKVRTSTNNSDRDVRREGDVWNTNNHHKNTQETHQVHTVFVAFRKGRGTVSAKLAHHLV